jgi:outer membrane receptor protein involved in Fe transport
MRRSLARLLCGLVATPLAAQTVVLEPEVVTAARTPQPPDQVPFSLKVLDGDALRAAPAATLDGALRTVPDFSLFRRSDSLTANPTVQGVSLRGLGPSGASRSLVVLDGVPLNDPFGGWVAWTLVPRESLAHAELVPGGGATAWGNAALGGVVQLFTDPPASAQNRFTGSAGDFSTRSAEMEITQPVGRGAVQLLGDAFSTDGFPLVAPERRGPIDVAAASHHSWLTARGLMPLGENLSATVTARTFTETRNNGTPYQHNASRANFTSVALAGQPAKNFSWNAVVYAQDQSFSSTFSSVNATRTAETPASDQFAVPATAFGAAWTGAWSHADGARTSAGLDFRQVNGETREHFTFVNGAFTRLRVAGGTQDVGGLFFLHEQPLAPDLRATFGGRLDRWSDTDGHRRESDLATNTASRDDHYANRDGTEFSPSAGLVWQAAPEWRVRAAAQHAYRRPTLNELYRPFRQGTTVVETNPDLHTEHVTTGELGVDFKRGPLTVGASAFRNDLHDAVDNVTLARGPGTFPLFGALPAGGIGRQRLNVDRIRVQGLELSASWHASTTLSLDAAALFNDATVRRASVAPGLVGNQVAQVPRHSATVGATWRAPGGITLTPRVRWLGRQFEDDENTLRLGEAVVADLGASRALTKHLELFLTIENLGNARIETGRSADGVVNTGTPRLALGGLRGSW